jgi:hypothetical protein
MKEEKKNKAKTMKRKKIMVSKAIIDVVQIKERMRC